MSENLIKRIRTAQGDLQVDYNALANLPDLSKVGVQSDWAENDKNSQGYIKNRTHYSTAQAPLSWDGDRTGYEYFTVTPKVSFLPVDDQAWYYVKVTDKIYTKKDFLNAEVSVSMHSAEDETVTIESGSFMEGDGYFTIGEYVITITKSGAFNENSTVGTYFLQTETADEQSYVSSLVFTNGTIKRLDPIYLPENAIINANVADVDGGQRLILTSGKGDTTIDVPKQVNSDWAQEDSSAVDYIKNKPKVSDDYVVLRDIETGFNYGVQMVNGNLVSHCATSYIEVTTMPNVVTYLQGQKFDPTGMVVTATCEDGNKKEITNYEVPSVIMEAGSNIWLPIRYNEFGKTYQDSIIVSVTAFNPDTHLIDFTYVANDNGTYTITGWKGTLNGETSTEMVIPNTSLIII